VHRERIVALAEQYRLPSAFGGDYWAKDGALLSYGPELIEAYRGAASYVDRILRGAKPADLPPQAPVKYRLSVNLKTARALGLTRAMGALTPRSGGDEIDFRVRGCFDGGEIWGAAVSGAMGEIRNPTLIRVAGNFG